MVSQPQQIALKHKTILSGVRRLYCHFLAYTNSLLQTARERLLKITKKMLLWATFSPHKNNASAKTTTQGMLAGFQSDHKVKKMQWQLFTDDTTILKLRPTTDLFLPKHTPLTVQSINGLRKTSTLKRCNRHYSLLLFIAWKVRKKLATIDAMRCEHNTESNRARYFE